MRRSGFTTIEMIIVVIMIGIIVAFGFPKLHGVLDKTNVRSARVAVGTYAAMARSAAIQRGCQAAVHFAYGTSSSVWVTSCRPLTGAIDTIGPVENLYAHFNVTLSATPLDSVRYDPRGLSLETVTTVVRFTGNVASNTDSLLIKRYTGKVVR
ncbi:MAG TPA: hypothetical protein VEM13_03590 [Gemmatimonadales bacterium]|nr:hypothetical protein [Gemmatimonadales bacterium]